jgi:putative oxidoreductase
MDRVWIDCYAPLVGRIFLGGLFLWNGIQAALNLPAAAQIFTAHGIPGGMYWAAAAIAVEALGGIAVVVGVWTRASALMLALYLILQSVFLTNFSNDAELNLFVINLGLVGGLLYVSAYGAGRWSAGKNSR